MKTVKKHFWIIDGWRKGETPEEITVEQLFDLKQYPTRKTARKEIARCKTNNGFIYKPKKITVSWEE